MTDEKKPKMPGYIPESLHGAARFYGWFEPKEPNTTMTDDWTKDFEKLLKNIRFVDKTSFEEVPGDVQLKAFIAEQRQKAREDEKKLWLLAITHLTSAQRESTLDTYEELNNMLGAAPTKE